jgi:molybdopterin/thiamine biosynthesis adenylyltransferase
MRRRIGTDRNARLGLLDGFWERSVVHQARVGVIGVGALGNEILKNLALLDFRDVLLVDPDVVEKSNLSRSVLFRARDEGRPKVDAAADALRDLNPDLRPEPVRADVVHDIGLGRLRQLDVIIAGLDSRRVRWWLNRTAHALGVPWVEGATQGGHGHAVAFLPGDVPCYECSFTDQDWRALHQVSSCQQLALGAAARGRVGTSPTSSSMVSAAQVHLAMDVLHGRDVVSGRSLLFNLTAPDLMVSGRRFNPDCEAHYRYQPIIPVPLSARTATVGALVEVAAVHVGAPAVIELRWDLVWAFECARCGPAPVRRPRGTVVFEELTCPLCGEERRPQFLQRLTAEDHGDELLADVAIPSHDVVEVQGPVGTAWLELAADRPEIELGPDVVNLSDETVVVVER